MTPRRWAIFIGINILISAVTSLLVLSLWDANQSAATPPLPTAVPTLSTAARTAVAATTTSAVTPTPANLQTYIVKDGDTLGDIARRFDVTVADIVAVNNLPNSDILSVGQKLMIPSGPVTPTPTLIPIPTSTRAALPVITGTAQTALGEAFVTIRDIKSVGDLAQEQAIFTNLSNQVNLAGWTVTDGEGHKFTFPDLTLLPKAEVVVHTTTGTNTATDLYWGEPDARWASGKVAYLRDPTGKLIATYQIP